jgi:hypothetical protein
MDRSWMTVSFHTFTYKKAAATRLLHAVKGTPVNTNLLLRYNDVNTARQNQLE